MAVAVRPVAVLRPAMETLVSGALSVCVKGASMVLTPLAMAATIADTDTFTAPSSLSGSLLPLLPLLLLAVVKGFLLHVT
jgi:hypothetical protein